MSGLGARTISPTDARRLKRLSTAPPKHHPPVPKAPLTPQPDFPMPPRASVHSPAVVPRKSSTPSSARNTPDPGRKAGNSGLSLTSTSSFSSLRGAANGGASSRNSQIVSSSRLPTPKPRNVHSSAGLVEEEVPPVPAIPKAYESPKDQDHLGSSYFGPRKSRTIDVDAMGRASANPEPAVPATKSSIRKVEEPQPRVSLDSQLNGRHRRGLTVGTAPGSERAPAGSNLNKKNLQPLMLPPLNLLPFNSPANARLPAFPAPSREVDGRHATPPPKRSNMKTPSTPMTASRATFFSRKHDEDDDFQLFNLRSSSSHHLTRTEDQPYRPVLSPSTPIAIPSPVTRHGAPTPFSSNSLPKNSVDFGHLLVNPADDYTYNHHINQEMVRSTIPSPKPIAPKKIDTASTRTSTSDEPSTPASTTSLRRKLSLNWKRSSSKASQRAKAEQAAKDEAAKAAKHKEMPPPRLPASATSSVIHSEPASSRPSLDSKFRKSSQTGLPSYSESEQLMANGQVDGSAKHEGPPPVEHRKVASRSSSSSLLSPMHRMLGGKNSAATLKARHLDSNLDKDDMAADKIMEKMASRRKDFEAAAKDVDELRRRASSKDKMSPIWAIQNLNLNIFERGEIIDYKEVYFTGTRHAKKRVGDLDAHANNFGYDDDRGDYNIVLGDHLAYRYEVVDVLGKGSFGQVVRCIDHKTGVLVAVKIIRNKKRFHQQALVEVNILQKLREWDPDNKHSMINFTQSFYFRGHLCISTELLGMNLYEFIKAYEFKGFPLPLIRRFTKQMLSALILLKSHRVIHCDLKPENILLAHPMHSEIKVIDFGSSCFENEKVYTYIQSRFYRSPEVILGMSYGIPIDMWSLGCILAELLTGYPIFPGENEQEQLACIMEIFGPPEKHLIEKSSRKKLFFDSMGKPRVTVSSKGRRRRPSSKTLQQALKCDDDAFLDFISRCLRWDPDRRLKPEEAMHHEFITGIKRPRVDTRVRSHGGPVGAAPSPIKRGLTAATPQRVTGQRDGSRPLPEPPATSFRNGTAVTTRDLPPSSSPVKGGPRRHSTMNSMQPTPAGVKRTSGGTAVGSASSSNLPRAAGGPVGGQQRSFSGRPDLASAAAVASLVSSPPSSLQMKMLTESEQRGSR
jgi:dual specificity tyrosine-phosphorylation-regulated kinase 2/3/4